MSVTTVDHGRGTLTTSTQKFSLKSQVDNRGREREYIEGFVATTHIDKGNDRFTEEALRMMAKDITQDSGTVDAVFRDMEESQIGNVNHDNNPAAPSGDTRIVPAFKIIDAEIRNTDDGETGLWIKGMLNSDGMPGDTVSAVKNSIKDGFLDAFSIEFVPEKVKRVVEGSKVVRVIEAAQAKGAAMTGRPMNPGAEMTGADLKSLASQYKVEYAYDIGDEVSWNETSGVIRDRTKDSCFNEEIDGDFEVCGTQEDPAYLIEVDNEEGTMVAHKQSLFTGKSMNVKQLSEEERTPPEAAQENAQIALDAKKETGNPNDCGTETGWRRAEQLVEGDPLSEEVISKMSQFARHEDNSDQGEEGRADCGWMMWKAWGGDEGVEWAQRTMDKMQGKNIGFKVESPMIQEPDYSATSEASWSKPNMEDFPEDYDALSIFLVRDEESDNFSDQALPVVDYRNGEATLVLEALRSAHTLASRVEGLSDEQVSEVRNSIERLAEDEFDVNLEMEGDSAHMEKNDISTMTDEEVQESEVEGDEPETKDDMEESGEGDEESEIKSFSEDVEELKSTVQEVKEVNEDLREENSELKSELEDLRQLQEIKSEVDEVKSLLEDVELEDGPRARQEQKDRFDQSQETKADWKNAVDRVGKDYLKSEDYIEAFAENHGIDSQEVKNYVNSD